MLFYPISCQIVQIEYLVIVHKKYAKIFSFPIDYFGNLWYNIYADG